MDFEIQLSGESANHFSAKVLDKGNAIAAQAFELRTVAKSKGEEAFNKAMETSGGKHDT